MERPRRSANALTGLARVSRRRGAEPRGSRLRPERVGRPGGREGLWRGSTPGRREPEPSTARGTARQDDRVHARGTRRSTTVLAASHRTSQANRRPQERAATRRRRRLASVLPTRDSGEGAVEGLRPGLTLARRRGNPPPGSTYSHFARRTLATRAPARVRTTAKRAASHLARWSRGRLLRLDRGLRLGRRRDRALVVVPERRGVERPLKDLPGSGPGRAAVTPWPRGVHEKRPPGIEPVVRSGIRSGAPSTNDERAPVSADDDEGSTTTTRIDDDEDRRRRRGSTTTTRIADDDEDRRRRRRGSPTTTRIADDDEDRRRRRGRRPQRDRPSSYAPRPRGRRPPRDRPDR